LPLPKKQGKESSTFYPVRWQQRGPPLFARKIRKNPIKISRRENPCGIFFMRVLLVLFLQEKNGPLFS
ncbi:hypothetical protein, partial [Gemmiger formicilis]|uniref:hypothetical protein n=1 Tax=Gemmiger formicilis TaxID=745368 RepID=UPI00195CA95F